ncbi:hypothetical protein OS493_029713 [Desmophyllum pertusum]|uniref:Serine protease n=1 Tax=Desmophyllum pertusum TaxID=174260 RepID=A0A9X0CXS2_9CNID|nr:hypothetical protein OS493_029713 [Desmophyllum pertusum]
MSYRYFDGSDKSRDLIDKRRADVQRELKEVTIDYERPQRYYRRGEAERRVKDCFAAGSFLEDTDVFPAKKGQSEIQNTLQTFDIVDINDSIYYFDTRKLYSKYPEKGPKCYKVLVKQSVDEQRAGIQREYDTATTNIEIEHGSGFIVHDHFIITNKHVIETYLDETENYEIYISNAAIVDNLCQVVRCYAGTDLALLCCPELNLEQSGILPLQLSKQCLLPGMSIFSFGYPISHTDETALFVNGYVSGFKKTLAGGCIVTHKHFKDILTLEERETIEKIRKSLETSAIPDLKDGDPCHTPMFLLTLKLYDALETHSQFNLSNALPGHFVIEFIKNSISEYEGEFKEELVEIVNKNLSQ